MQQFQSDKYLKEFAERGYPLRQLIRDARVSGCKHLLLLIDRVPEHPEGGYGQTQFIEYRAKLNELDSGFLKSHQVRFVHKDESLNIVRAEYGENSEKEIADVIDIDPKERWNVDDVFNFNTYFNVSGDNGFGQVSISTREDGTFFCMNEGWSKDVVRDLLHKLVDRVIDEAEMDI